jgi:RNA polymerase sigma-70 factor (ECF subfamily)
MSQTSVSLLERLRDEPDGAAWRRLVELCTPLIRNWLRRQEVRDQDAEDVTQEVLAVVVRKLPAFRRQPRAGAFRSWLRQITVNCLRGFWRSRRGQPQPAGGSDFAHMLDQLADPASGLSQVWNKEHDDHMTRRLLEMIRPRFEAKTWQAFQRVVLEGAAVDAVARDLGMSVNAVFIAKSRVAHLLRQEGAGLVDGC